MFNRLLFSAAFAAVLSLTTAAHATPVGVDGMLGAEWANVTPVVVLHDANAPTSNFSTPSIGTQGIGYNVYLRSDANYLYGMVMANGNTGGLNFANLYFNTDLSGGSDLGIEVTNDRAFNPGVPGYFDLSNYLTVAESANNVNHAIEFALSWDYFTNNPDGFLPVGTNITNGIQLRTSQSFGYTATGGNMNPDFSGPRFGTVAEANAVPEPSSLALCLLALGMMGLVARKAKSAS